MDDTIVYQALAQSQQDFRHQVDRICDLHSAGLSIDTFRVTIKELCVLQGLEQYIGRVGAENLTGSDAEFMRLIKESVSSQVDSVTADDLQNPGRVADFVFSLVSGDTAPTTIKEEPAPPSSIRDKIDAVMSRRYGMTTVKEAADVLRGQLDAAINDFRIYEGEQE